MHAVQYQSRRDESHLDRTIRTSSPARPAVGVAGDIEPIDRERHRGEGARDATATVDTDVRGRVIERFARLVGRERMIASTDCSLGGRIHPQIATAKLAALSEGARLATQQLWH